MSSQKNIKEIIDHKIIYDSFFDVLQEKNIHINYINIDKNNTMNHDNNNNNNSENYYNKKENDFENKKRIERESEKRVNQLLRGFTF